MSGSFANDNNEADRNGQDGNVTTEGTNFGASFYGAFDVNGNVREWNDLTGATGSSRGLRGGVWNRGAVSMSSSFRNPPNDPSDVYSNVGFRLASAFSDSSGVPEIDPAGVGSVLSPVTGVLGFLERRRKPT